MIYPGDRELTERERTNICYLAFPDSNSGLMGNVQFHFRIRQCPQSNPLHTRPAMHQYNATCPTSIQVMASFLFPIKNFLYYNTNDDIMVNSFPCRFKENAFDNNIFSI